MSAASITYCSIEDAWGPVTKASWGAAKTVHEHFEEPAKPADNKAKPAIKGAHEGVVKSLLFGAAVLYVLHHLTREDA